MCASVTEKVESLLERMTIEEKIGQMILADGRKEPEYWLKEKHAGAFLHLLGRPALALQKAAREETRLGIPLLFGIDAIHGHGFWPGAVVFPTQLALSCSWNPALVEEMGRITAKDVRTSGAHWTFSPVLDVARDLRWGRVGETFGEDPFLAGELGCALIRGYQGGTAGSPGRILACAKHFAGYSETQGGRDSSEAELSPRKLKMFFLPPFERAAREGCATFMTAYHAVDGVPCTLNRTLLTDILKREWKFEGFVVTDWGNVERVRTFQHVCESFEEAVCKAVEAGNDMIMTTPAFADAAVEAVRKGALRQGLVDEACRRILRMKFRLGLFDEPTPDPARAVFPDAPPAGDREAAFEAAVQSIVLLKNKADILPLPDTISSIAVIGPNADDPQNQLGDWARLSGQGVRVDRPYAAGEVVTVLRGIRDRVPRAAVTYARGCDAVDGDTAGIQEARDAAAAADAAVLVVGDALPLIGETCDRADLRLSGAQEELCRAVHETGTPLIAVLVNSKPLAVPWLAEHADAVIEAFNPGMEGGRAVAAVLFGDRNPCGKLTVSFPRHVGQQPVWYNQMPGWHAERYADMDASPLFPFGFGLSYTTYAYSNLRVRAARLEPGTPLVCSVDVENTGKRAGTEIVQLYVRDIHASVTTPVKELKAFARVDLDPGEKKTVTLSVPYEELSIVTPGGNRVVEPGAFAVMVGPSSRDDDLLAIEVTVEA